MGFSIYSFKFDLNEQLIFDVIETHYRDLDGWMLWIGSHLKTISLDQHSINYNRIDYT
jgi:hypothetical protein